jgi:hypothetical protein
MKKKYFNLLQFIFLFFIVSACASTASTTTDNKSGSPKTEDLSKYRPKFKVPEASTKTDAGANPFTPLPGTTPTNHVNELVTALLDTVATMNKSVRYAQGYRILAYSGTERKAAMDIRTAIINRVPEERDYLQYKQPTFRLKIGDYFNRLEAQQVLQRIKDIIPNAMIVVDQINIK